MNIEERLNRLENIVNQLGEFIQTKRLVILDQQDNPKIRLSIVNGEPLICFYDKKRTHVIHLGISDNNPRLAFSDEQGVRRAVLKLEHGKPRLSMFDKKGDMQIELGISDYGEPQLEIYDQNDTPIPP